jgi:hypothetical protein
MPTGYPHARCTKAFYRQSASLVRSLKVVGSCALLSALALANGCGGTAPVPSSHQAVTFSGRVHGGQQPVTGATIQLYAATTNGDETPAMVVLGTGTSGISLVQSDLNGNFSITMDYACPSAATPVYLTATGGTPGPRRRNQ